MTTVKGIKPILFIRTSKSMGKIKWANLVITHKKRKIPSNQRTKSSADHHVFRQTIAHTLHY